MQPLRRCQLKGDVDLAIVGAGFGGSIMAMVAHRLGLSVVLLEQGTHPRMAIGESTTPLSNLLLEQLNTTYDLPRLAPLAKWGSWQRAYPQVACGLKRGFTFFHGQDRLLVAASPRDEIADVHWYRADVDHFLVSEAQRMGIEYRDQAGIDSVNFAEDGVAMVGHTGDEAIQIRAGMLIDATGPRGFIHRRLQLCESRFPGLPATESLYSHFTGVTRTEWAGEMPPYPVDDAAVHHVFEGGWVWVLRFHNGVTSAGVAATREVATELRLSEGEAAWHRLLERLPALKSQFTNAVACQPFRYMPQVGFRSQTIVGKRWAMLPSAAGFVDPLLSTGFALTLKGIERLARLLSANLGSVELARQLQDYSTETEGDLLAASGMIGALYATMGNFPAFTAVSLLYFAAVSFSETAYRLGKPELAPGFLLHQHPVFGPGARLLLERAYRLNGDDATRAFVEAVVRTIEPFNVGGFGDPARNNRYPVHADDLLEAGDKLGAGRQEMIAMLDKSGFFAAVNR